MHARSRTKGHAMTATKTPRELIAECAEQLSADGHYELSLEIALIKAAQPDLESDRYQALAWVEVVSELSKINPNCMAGPGTGIECAVREIQRLAESAQPAPAAPYKVTDEDVQTVFDVYWAPGNSTVNGETMRRALEAYEARKAAA